MEIIPRKCCVRYDPPTLVLFYELKLSGKLHRRSIPLRDFHSQEDDEEKILNTLLDTPHHAKYIKEFNEDQVKRILKVLVDKNRGININIQSSISNNNSSNKNADDDNNNNNTNNINNNNENEENVLPVLPVHIDLKSDDLNKLDDCDLQKVKDVMEETFAKNRLKPGDDGWKYDNEVDFGTPQGAIESSAWDDDDDDSDMEF